MLTLAVNNAFTVTQSTQTTNKANSRQPKPLTYNENFVTTRHILYPKVWDIRTKAWDVHTKAWDIHTKTWDAKYIVKKKLFSADDTQPSTGLVSKDL